MIDHGDIPFKRTGWQEARVMFGLSDLMHARKIPPERMADLIRAESEKIEDARGRYLYIVRSLFDIGDARGRALNNEELAILDKIVRHEPLGSDDDDFLKMHEDEYISDPFAAKEL